MKSKTKSPETPGAVGDPQSKPPPGAGAIAPKSKDAPVANTPADSAVADFVAKIKALGPAAGAGRGRLIFAMDATMSRQPTWDMALALQSDMFATVKDVGGLDVQLTFFRGHGECKSSRWVSDPDQLSDLMRRVACQGGLTQLGRVLSAARNEASEKKVNALVYVGDAMEENIDQVCARAGELALCGVPAFMFQEGHDANASLAFKEVARLTRGAYCRFDAGSAKQLRDLLTAVAAYAAGGHRALLALSRSKNGAGAHLLIAQMPPVQK
jgi:hypothetical protein